MERADEQNSGVTVLRAPGATELRSFVFGGSGRAWGYRPGMAVWTSPAIVEQDGKAVLFVGSYDRKLYALDAATGEELWSFAAGDMITGTPVVGPAGGENAVFFGSGDRLVYALDARIGRRLWIHQLSDYSPTVGAAKVSAGAIAELGAEPRIFFSHWVWDRSLTQNFQEGAVTALRAEDGKLVWKSVLGDNDLTAPIVLADGEHSLIFVGSSSGKLFALQAETGETAWQRTELDAIMGAPAIFALPSGPLLITASKSGIVRCLDARTGEERWKYRTGDWVTSSPAVAVLRGRPMALVGSYDRTLYALDILSGELIWRHHAEGGIYSSPAVISSGARATALTTSWDNHLRGVNLMDGSLLFKVYTGRPLWDTVGLEHSGWSAPAAAQINDQWMVYFGSYDGKLYGFSMSELLLRGDRRERSNLSFWLSFPVVLGLVVALALFLTRRSRKQAELSRG